MTLDEWIAFYNKKAPEPFVRDERYELFFLPDKGFCEVGQTKDMVIVRALAGDARFWHSKVTEMAASVGLPMGGTWCVRKAIKAYIRLFGFLIEREEKTSDGRTRYHCKHKYTKKKGLASPAFTCADGTQAYFITWEV
ncbi:MAG: hypothetical protein IJ521_02150 [Schwartzia sp.]|nr:hypothetical protein [Schwartzia sp. (in: firmicutes)]